MKHKNETELNNFFIKTFIFFCKLQVFILQLLQLVGSAFWNKPMFLTTEYFDKMNILTKVD